MKHIVYIVAILAMLAACKDDETAGVTALSIEKTELTVGADGAEETLEVSAPAEWYASADEPWVAVSPATGMGCGECVISIDSTLINDVRTAKVSFTAADGQRQVLTVHQTGYGNVIHTDSTEFHIVASQRVRDDRHIDIAVTTNVPFYIEIKYSEGSANWLTVGSTEVKLDHGARPRTASLRFDWTNNNAQEERRAEVVFKSDKASHSVTIVQAPAKRIEDSREGDSLAIIIMSEAMDIYNAWPTNEKLENWGDIRLWEKTDKELPCAEAVGRVRDIRFMMVNVADGETLPVEVKYLKYLESISYYSNVNSFLKTIHLGKEICSLKHLKSIEAFGIGLVDLPEELTQLSGTLESLRLACNNFNGIPAVLTKENFPKLRRLEMHANRRWTVTDLRKRDDSSNEGGIGLYFHTSTNDALKRLLLWDTLEELVLSYNYIEGSVPDFKVGEDGVEAWSQADVDAWGGDTIQWLADNRIPKIMPNAKRLTLNLNFFTGALPDWLLYHPRLMEWTPDILIFNQMENGLNSEGKPVRFSNEPNNFEYYYEAFPKYRSKYEIKEEWEDE